MVAGFSFLEAGGQEYQLKINKTFQNTTSKEMEMYLVFGPSLENWILAGLWESGDGPVTCALRSGGEY
jgi:hypothetical protein